MTTKEEKTKKLEKLEEKIINDLESIDDPKLLREKLDVLFLVTQVIRFREDNKGVYKCLSSG